MQNQSKSGAGQPSGREPFGQDASGPGTSLADKAERAAEQAKNKAIERVQSMREQAESEIDQGRTQVVERIRHVSSALRSAGLELQSNDPVIARYVDRASDRVDSIATYVGSTDAKKLLNDVQDFARQRPAWFFGGTFLAGLAVARFLKSSAGGGSGPFNIEDSDIEDVSEQNYGYNAVSRRQRAYSGSSGQPITPSATIPVTQGQRTPGSQGAGTPVSTMPRSDDSFDAGLPGAIPGARTGSNQS